MLGKGQGHPFPQSLLLVVNAAAVPGSATGAHAHEPSRTGNNINTMTPVLKKKQFLHDLSRRPGICVFLKQTNKAKLISAQMTIKEAVCQAASQQSSQVPTMKGKPCYPSLGVPGFRFFFSFFILLFFLNVKLFLWCVCVPHSTVYERKAENKIKLSCQVRRQQTPLPTILLVSP